jgi:hypothetical protein
MFFIWFADLFHGCQALDIGGISPWVFTGFKIGERSFFNDFLHEVILGDILLHEKEEEE